MSVILFVIIIKYTSKKCTQGENKRRIVCVVILFRFEERWFVNTTIIGSDRSKPNNKILLKCILLS